MAISIDLPMVRTVKREIAYDRIIENRFYAIQGDTQIIWHSCYLWYVLYMLYKF